MACRQLGYSRGERLKSGTPRVVNSELTVDCTGTENSISDCTEFELEGFNCYRIDAFINCSSEGWFHRFPIKNKIFEKFIGSPKEFFCVIK